MSKGNLNISVQVILNNPTQNSYYVHVHIAKLNTSKQVVSKD